ncbi:MAG TPA: diiron oxygenase, partial [Micromonosporaceae bacterium]|nr:diiron oxygenase [Micromonosporaceae bacterium]
ERETGVTWQQGGLPAFIPRLDAIRVRLPEHLRGAEGLLFSVVSETLISSILADVPRDRRLPQTVREVIRDHAEDEGRHHAYFRTVLHHFWPALDASDRRAIGPYLPEIILAFLEPDYQTVAGSLARIGHTAADVEQILAESWPTDRVRRDSAEAARYVIRYLEEVGALDDPRTKDAFTAAGLAG